VTNEGVAEETREELDERSSMIAYVGRASFRMVPTAVPGNDNHEITLRIRIPTPQSGIEQDQGNERPRLMSGVASLLVARLEVPRWILATVTLLVFAGGVLFATSLVGGARPTYARTEPPVASAAPLRPTLALVPLPSAANVTAAPPERTVASRREPKPAATPAPVRRPRKSAAPRSPSGGPARPEAITTRWVDPFAE
jgi:hypothetical protein